MSTITKYLTLSLAVMVLTLTAVSPARADYGEEGCVKEMEAYARTRTRQEANGIVARITAGQIPGWMLASVEYDARTRTYLVMASRTNDSVPRRFVPGLARRQDPVVTGMPDVVIRSTPQFYSRTPIRQHADNLVWHINAGRVRGWKNARLYYDGKTRTFLVYAARTN